VFPKKNPTARTAVVLWIVAMGWGTEEETPKINKPFSHIAERRVLVFGSMRKTR